MACLWESKDWRGTATCQVAPLVALTWGGVVEPSPAWQVEVVVAVVAGTVGMMEGKMEVVVVETIDEAWTLMLDP